MKNLKKLAASLAAFTTALSLSVGTLSVTANEIKKDIDKTFAEKAFVASFTNEEYKEVAKYLINNNVLLDDAKIIMNQYIEGDHKETKEFGNKKIKNTVSLKSDSDDEEEKKPVEFYSSENLSKNQHYCVILSRNGSYKNDDTNLALVYSESSTYGLISSNDSLNIRNLKNTVNMMGMVISGETGERIWDIYGSVKLGSSSKKTVGVIDFPFNVNTNIAKNKSKNNEAAIYEVLHWDSDDDDNDPDNDFYAPFFYHTYVQGDVDHSGCLDSTDVNWLIRYNMGKNPPIPVNYIYDDDNPYFNINVAKIINNLAKDADRNGVLDLADVTWVAKHVDKPITKK